MTTHARRSAAGCKPIALPVALSTADADSRSPASPPVLTATCARNAEDRTGHVMSNSRNAAFTKGVYVLQRGHAVPIALRSTQVLTSPHAGLWGAHVPCEHSHVAQSPSALQAWPTAQLAHAEPPQSVSMANGVRQCTPTEQAQRQQPTDVAFVAVFDAIRARRCRADAVGTHPTRAGCTTGAGCAGVTRATGSTAIDACFTAVLDAIRARRGCRNKRHAAQHESGVGRVSLIQTLIVVPWHTPCRHTPLVQSNPTEHDSPGSPTEVRSSQRSPSQCMGSSHWHLPRVDMLHMPLPLQKERQS